MVAKFTAIAKSLRSRTGLHQWQFGELLGVDRLTIVRWETRAARIGDRHRALLEQLAQVPDDKLRAIAGAMASTGPLLALHLMLWEAYGPAAPPAAPAAPGFELPSAAGRRSLVSRTVGGVRSREVMIAHRRGCPKISFRFFQEGTSIKFYPRRGGATSVGAGARSPSNKCPSCGGLVLGNAPKKRPREAAAARKK